MAVRRYSKSGAISVGVGLVGGIALWSLTGAATLLWLGIIVAVVGGGRAWLKINRIINYKD